MGVKKTIDNGGVLLFQRVEDGRGKGRAGHLLPVRASDGEDDTGVISGPGGGHSYCSNRPYCAVNPARQDRGIPHLDMQL